MGCIEAQPQKASAKMPSATASVTGQIFFFAIFFSLYFGNKVFVMRFISLNSLFFQ
jgi:hypothetical protein